MHKTDVFVGGYWVESARRTIGVSSERKVGAMNMAVRASSVVPPSPVPQPAAALFPVLDGDGPSNDSGTRGRVTHLSGQPVPRNNRIAVGGS